MARVDPRKVYVAGFPEDATKEELVKWCSQVGEVANFRLVVNKRSAEGQCFGFCSYYGIAAADRALAELSTKPFRGNIMLVVRHALIPGHMIAAAKHRRSRSPSPRSRRYFGEEDSRPVSTERGRSRRRRSPSVDIRLPSPSSSRSSPSPDRNRDRERDHDRRIRAHAERELELQARPRPCAETTENNNSALDDFLRDAYQQQKQQQLRSTLAIPRYGVLAPPPANRTRLDTVLKLVMLLPPEDLQLLPPTEATLLQSLQDVLLHGGTERKVY